MILEETQFGRLKAAARTELRKEGFRHSAVLVPVVRLGSEDHLLLTRRSEHLPHHRGQIAFPGGAIDEGETAEQAALREAYEEVQLPAESVNLVCKLNDIWTPSEYIITPVLGIVASIEDLVPNPGEVDRVFTAPLSFFAANMNVEIREVSVRGYQREVYFYHFDGETIWGATAFIIRDLLRQTGNLDEAQ